MPVIVLDAKYNPPVFSLIVYKTVIPENTPPIRVVLKVAAADADEGLNGEVAYEISHISEAGKKVFALNPKTGEINVIGPTDFEDETV